MKIVPLEQSYREEYLNLLAGYFDFYGWNQPNSAEIEFYFQSLLSNPKEALSFLALDNSVSVGFVTLYFTWSTSRLSRIAIMNDLYVDPKARGMGVGRALFKFAWSYAKENEYSALEWVTAEDNEIAQQLYTSEGGRGSKWMLFSKTTEHG